MAGFVGTLLEVEIGWQSLRNLAVEKELEQNSQRTSQENTAKRRDRQRDIFVDISNLCTHCSSTRVSKKILLTR